MSAYLDTHIAVRLADGDLDKLSPAAMQMIGGTDLLLSPMVLIELDYLFELNKIRLSADDVQRKLEFELGVRVCQFSFQKIARVASREQWTRDPFDRIIVAHSRANGISPLISADRLISQNYPRTVW